MCKLGEQMKNEVVSETKPKTMYRWFLVKEQMNKKVTVTPVFKTESRVWNQKVAKAHLVPQLGGMTGLYGYSSISAAKGDKPNKLAVLAEIKVWGKTVVHSNGRRAQFGKIVRFFTTFSRGEIFSYEKSKYVPVVSKMEKDFKEKITQSTYFGHIPLTSLKKSAKKKTSVKKKKAVVKKKKTATKKKK